MRSRPAAATRPASAALFFAASVAAAVLPATLSGQERTLDIRSFRSEILVRRDGSLSVKETIVVQFQGEWNGIYRTIPVEYRSSQNLNYTLRLRVTGVHDEAGNELRSEQERQGGDLQIKGIGNPNAISPSSP